MEEHMNDLNVRTVTLDPMRVICLSGFGTEPETQAWGKLIAWAKSKGLYNDGTPRRFFGFNNPDPSPGSPNYGYDVWMTVGPDVQPDGEARLVEFPGGLYAVARCEVVNPYDDIPQTWQRMVTWMENSPYSHGQHQWLEESLTPIEDASQGFVLDLYLPIK
jgi:DNA gyrase inhibitor GyrI